MQDKFGDMLCKFLNETKIVVRGDFNIDAATNKIDTSNMYIVLIDKSRGKDISKNTIKFQGSIKKTGKVKIKVDSKLTFPKRNK